MSDGPVDSALPAGGAGVLSPVGWRDHPLFVREATERPGSAAMPATITAFVVILGTVALIGFSVAHSNAAGRAAAVDMANVAFLATGLELLLLLVIVPPLAAASATKAMARARARVIEGRRAWLRIAAEELAGIVAFPLLLMVVAFPVVLATFLYAGLDPATVVVAQSLGVGAVLATGALGVAVGTRMNRELSATLVTYGLGLVLMAGAGLAGIALHHGSDRASPESVHPLVFANAFYAAHALTVGPSPADLHVGQLLALARQDHSTTRTAGPAVAPWTASTATLLLVTGLALGSSAGVLARSAASGDSGPPPGGRLLNRLRQPLRLHRPGGRHRDSAAGHAVVTPRPPEPGMPEPVTTQDTSPSPES